MAEPERASDGKRVPFWAIFVHYLSHPDGFNSVRKKTKVGVWVLCRWVITTVVWGSFGYHSFAIRGWKPLFEPKSCLNDAATAIVLLQSNHQYLRFAHIGRLRCSIVIKDCHFQELQLIMSWSSHILIDFHPRKVIESTATTAVFKWKLVRHITAVSKLFWRCQFFNPILVAIKKF